MVSGYSQAYSPYSGGWDPFSGCSGVVSRNSCKGGHFSADSGNHLYKQRVTAQKYFKMFFSAIIEGRRDYASLLPMTIGIK